MIFTPQEQPLHLFEMTFEVAASDCQTAFRMTLPALLRWLQEIAGRHAAQLGISIQALQQNHLTWMLGRMSLRLFRAPQWGESVRLTTWPSGIRGRLIAERQFILETITGEPLLIASSEWLCVNLETGRLAPLPDSVKTLSTPTTHSFALCNAKFPSLPAIQAPFQTLSFPVRRQEIDANRHVNNVHYVEWMQETLPEDLFFNHTPSFFDIEYKRAAKLGDAIQAQSWVLESDSFLHEIRSIDGTLLARALSNYNQKDS